MKSVLITALLSSVYAFDFESICTNLSIQDGDARNLTVYERGKCFLTCAALDNIDSRESICRNADFGLGPGRPATLGTNPELSAALSTSSKFAPAFALHRYYFSAG